MSNKNRSLSEVLKVLSDSLTPEEIITAGIEAKISASIAAIRIENGLSQAEFAARLGVTQGLVSRWESGTCNYRISTLAKIIAVFDADYSFSISPKREPTTSNIITYFQDEKNDQSVASNSIDADETQYCSESYNMAGNMDNHKNCIYITPISSHYAKEM